MTDPQQPQPFRFVLEFKGELTDPQAVILDQLTTIRAEGSDEVAPFVEDDPFNALRYAIMLRAMREITSIPGVRMTGFPNHMRRPNDRGGYDELVLPEELSQEDMQKKFDELERKGGTEAAEPSAVPAGFPWDPRTVGKNDDGSFDVLIRARVTAEGLEAAQSAALTGPASAPEHLPLLVSAENMLASAVSAQLVGQETMGVAVTFETAQVTSTPGNAAHATRHHE